MVKWEELYIYTESLRSRASALWYIDKMSNSVLRTVVDVVMPE